MFKGTVTKNSHGNLEFTFDDGTTATFEFAAWIPNDDDPSNEIRDNAKISPNAKITPEKLTELAYKNIACDLFPSPIIN